FRSLNQWRQILPAVGLAFSDREPVFALNNHLTSLALDLPGFVGAAQHLLDLPILRAMPSVANNWAVLARKGGWWQDGGSIEEAFGLTTDSRIAVVIPARNAGAFLREALDSVFAQDVRPAEVVVVDDGSTDDTRAVARGYGRGVKCLT